MIDHVPSTRLPNVHEPPDNAHVTLLDPDLAAVTVPVAPAVSPATEMVGVESNVMSSVDDIPESLDESRSG